jgi:hypothetical protein
MKHKFNKVALSINAHPDDAEAWNTIALMKHRVSFKQN